MKFFFYDDGTTFLSFHAYHYASFNRNVYDVHISQDSLHISLVQAEDLRFWTSATENKIHFTKVFHYESVFEDQVTTMLIFIHM